MNIKKYIKSPFLWAFLLGIASLHLIKEMALKRRSAPEPMVIVPDWQLLDQDGNIFGKKDLQGKVFIADFFFTSCPTICPMLTKSMKDVRDRVSKDIHFVSITVDPETDTPQVLRKFMIENNIYNANWHALTGSKKDIYETVVDKMRIHVGEKEMLSAKDNIYDIPHLAHLALFDQKGNLRGLFKTESIELAALVRAAQFLLEEE